ncbi:hypothetical protein JXB12_05610 [candidate division KSB1 bacterium]|nr:hypothetical protein [candidate division KSB1 bacterium]
MGKRCEIVATLGPGVEDLIYELLEAGVTSFRLNCSHISFEELSRWLLKINEALTRWGRVVPLWLDLQGAKLRIGKLQQMTFVHSDELITFANQYSQIDHRIPLPHPKIYRTITVGDDISLDDGRIQGMVVDADEDSFVVKVTSGGELISYKGFNKMGYDREIETLFAKDITFIEQTREFEHVGYALSYIQSAREVKLFKECTLDHPITAKIERLKSFDNLREIAEIADSLWLCRGDLGVNTSLFDLFHYEKEFIKRLELVQKPLLVAGQVFENMVTHSHPSRSEISHLGYLIENGFSGVVMSDETAIGRYPVRAVEFCRDYFEYMNH